MELTDLKVAYPTWVRQGEDFHKLEEELWQRRNLSRFGLQEGDRHHNLFLQNQELGLHGIVDMAIDTSDAVYATEFKISANNKKRGDVLQLTAYAMLLERHFQKQSRYGFLIGKGRVLHTIQIDEEKRADVKSVVGNIRKMLVDGFKPETSASYNQCCTCEYLNFCNDRL